MKNSDRIDIIISKIDWSTIRKYHKKLDIFWEVENKDGEKTLRIPAEKDLKEELRSILQYMAEERMEYLSYGNWIIYWNIETVTNDDRLLGEIRVIFRISDYTFTDNPESHKQFQKNISGLDASNLESLLENALKEEDYENAAIIRDCISAIKK
jgi:hypothetical protein